MADIEVKNWKGSITYHAHSVEKVTSVEQIQSIVRNVEQYPSPVRVRGSHHSTTECVVAAGGTVIDISSMNRILDINADARTITMEAGVLHIDAAKELEAHGLQFYVNIELGNMTVGSGACGGTKDASFVSNGEVEYGQVAAYCVAMKAVQADGSILTVSGDQSELMAAMRSSYGMLGVIFEVTYRVKPLRPMAVEHHSYHVDEFAERFESLIAEGRSMMMYLFPYLDRVVVEYRFDGVGPVRSGSWQWRLRNWVWKTGSPGFARIVGLLIPWAGLRSWILDCYNRFSQWVIVLVLRGCSTSPADQIIRYPETGGFASYTFSIWSFPRESYGRTIKDYFAFCKSYFREHGYRCDLLNVGYSIAEDQQSLFSYTRNGHGLTLDPVSTGGAGWDEFLVAYNQFSSQHGGMPLLNQTPAVTPQQLRAAFGPQIAAFDALRRSRDPAERFFTPFFRKLFSD